MRKVVFLLFFLFFYQKPADGVSPCPDWKAPIYLPSVWIKHCCAQAPSHPSSSLTRRPQGNRSCKQSLISLGFPKSRLTPQNNICIHQHSFAFFPSHSSAFHFVGLVNRETTRGRGFWHDHVRTQTHFTYIQRAKMDSLAFYRRMSKEYVVTFRTVIKLKKLRDWLSMIFAQTAEELLGLLRAGQKLLTKFSDFSQLRD